MSGAEGKILELGVGLIAALMVIREVLNFLDKKRGGTEEAGSLMS